MRSHSAEWHQVGRVLGGGAGVSAIVGAPLRNPQETSWHCQGQVPLGTAPEAVPAQGGLRPHAAPPGPEEES